MKGLKSALQAAASAAAAATSAAAAVTSAAVEAASGPRALREYALLQPDRPEARAGLGGIWSVHLARPKRQGSAAALPLVSVWLLDKRALLLAASTTSSSPEEAEAALAAARAGAAALARVKHPSFLRVIEPLEETRHVLALVTEGVWGTASELLTTVSESGSSGSGSGSGSGSSSSARAKEARSVSRLEILHGLANVSRAVAFLHRGSKNSSSSSSSASGSTAIVHRALGPAAVVLTRSGGWKLAGMELSVPESDPACQRAGGSFFDFGGGFSGGGARGGGGGGGGTSSTSSSSSSFPQRFDVSAASRPELAYASPELVEASTPLTTATDVFSLGALAASLLSARRAPLFFPSDSPRTHLAAVRALASSLGGLSSMELRNGGCCCDPAAAASLAPLLSPDPAARPRAEEVERLPLFAADEGLRAIRALEAMSSLPSSAAAFAASNDFGTAAAAGGGFLDGEAPGGGGGGGGKLRVLSRVRELLPSFDARVKSCLVLPPLLLEARAAARAGSASAGSGDGETLAVCLSIILDIARTQGKAEFEASTLPALRAVCANMFSAPSPKRRQQVAPAAAAAAAASEGNAATTATAALPPPPPPPTVTATPAALVLLERAPFLAPRCPADLLLPLVCRALDTASDSGALSSTDASAAAAAAVARAQELAAAACPSVGASAGPQASEAQLLPRLHRLALATTAARVRAACFRALGELCAGSGGGGGEDALSPSSSSFQQGRAPEPLPRETAVAALASFSRAAAVDGSASTADAGIALAASLAGRWGPQLAAQNAIPALSPLLAHGEEVLPEDAFGRVAEAIRGHVAVIEAERAARRGRGNKGAGGGGSGVGGMMTRTTTALSSAGATRQPAAAPAAAAAAAAPRAQATLHPLFASSAPAATTKAAVPPPPPPLPAPVLLPPPPPASVAVGKRHQFFPPPPAAATAAPPPSADRVPSLGLSSDLFGDWSVAETGGSGSGSGSGEKAPAAAAAAAAGGTPLAAADNGGGGADAAFDALFAAAAVSAKQRQEPKQQHQQQQQQQEAVSGGARGAPMRPRPAPPPPPPPPPANNGGSNSLI